jgi:hypothetical protein
MRNAYKISIAKSDVKRSLERCRNRWEDSIKMDKEVGCEGVDWTQLVQDTVRWRTPVSTVMNLRGIF